MREYRVVEREAEHPQPHPTWGCRSGKGWQFTGFAFAVTDEGAGRDYLGWLRGEHKDEVKALSDGEDLASGNGAHLAWACEQLTEYKLVSREVGRWEDVGD